MFAEKKTKQNALIIDHFSVACKRKLKTKLSAEIIGYVPKETSRAASFFINHAGKVIGSVYSSHCVPSPIARIGLEVLVDCDFKIEARKLKLLERLKDIIEKNLDEPRKTPLGNCDIVGKDIAFFFHLFVGQPEFFHQGLAPCVRGSFLAAH